MDRRLERVVRGALDRECQPGKLETTSERSVNYCCYSSYCNRTAAKTLMRDALMNAGALLVLAVLIVE